MGTMPGESFCFGMLRRREVVLPSLRGCLMLIAGFAAAGWLALTRIHPFLAVEKPLGGEVLVVEGWIPDYALRQALSGFRSGPYRLMLVTGGPLPQGTAYARYGTYAHLAAAMLKEFGLGGDSIVVVPSTLVDKDRTYQEGLSVGEWMRAQGKAPASLDVVSFSTHARRSRLLFAKALGGKTPVGIFAPRDIGYDPAVWWKTSNGVRRVLDETIAYLYAKLVFRG
jgi:hypothetical protein